MDVVLGHPYSGALFGYFSDQIGGEWSHTKRAKGHSYYRTLYGRNYSAYVELALTFLLLYDKVWVTPADNEMPKSKIDQGNRSYIPELGLYSDWDDFRPYSDHFRSGYVDEHLADERLQHILRSLRLPQSSWGMIVESAVYEADLSVRNRSPLLCSPGRRALIQMLIEIDRPAIHPLMPTIQGVEFIESYQSLTGMALRPRSIDDLMDAKPDSVVRTYGARFLDVAMSKGGDETIDERYVADLIREAMETQRIARLFSGALKWIGRMCGFTHIHVGSVGARLASPLVDHVTTRSGWYEFSGSIDRAIDKAQLVRRINEAISKDK